MLYFFLIYFIVTALEKLDTTDKWILFQIWFELAILEFNHHKLFKDDLLSDSLESVNPAEVSNFIFQENWYLKSC